MSSSASIRSRRRAASSYRSASECAARRARRRGSAAAGSSSSAAVSARAASEARLRRRERPVRPGRARHDHVLPSRPQVHVAVGPGAARVRRRTKLAQEAQLLEPGLELGAQHAPLDAVERTQRRLHRRPLPLRAEVRAQPRPQVARPAHVEHLAGPVEEEVDAGPLRSVEGERALRVDAAGARRAELLEVGDRLGAALLCEPDQAEQDLRRRLGVGKRAVARAHARAEEPRERRQAGPRGATGEQATSEPDRVDHRRRDPPPRLPLGLAVEEGEVEACVVGDEDGVAGEGEEPPHRRGHGRRRPQVLVGYPCQRADRGRQAHARVRERLEPRGELECLHADGADLADAGGRRREAGRLEVDHDETGELERQALGRGLGQRDEVAAPREPRIGTHRLLEQPPGGPVGKPPEREEPPRCLLGGNGPAALLDELDEPVGRVQAKLHDEPL